MGYSEIYTYSFISPSAYDKIGLDEKSPLRSSTVILNPLGEDTSVMRTTPLPSMLETLSRNMSYRNQNVRLYELATVYRPMGETLPDERSILTLGAYGKMDFFSLKGCVEALLGDLRVKDVTFEAVSGNSSYHPGRCAAISSGNTVIGVIGQIHPAVAKSCDLGETYAAELDFMALIGCRAPEAKYAPLPRFPAVARDIALVCDAAVTVAALENCIRRGGGALLREVELFDIYTGSQVPEGKKSVAFSLKLRADDMTLTDEHADAATKKILALLEKELGAVIR
jgi:phenylalanyl-tRNA synthetase beta chain